ncbi:hypothetical protein [Egbenema bharatensis]|uniref:hypothetical protein n=1 Tax=Egbenema bharatensis TaxID=3463334 RepID=UPI003A857F37
MRLSIGLRSIMKAAVGSVMLSSAGIGIALPGMAQALPACEPPRASEYLLLVLNQSADTATQLTELLPENAAISTCDYLDESVVRVGGFASAEIANAWAQYVNDMAGLQAFVAFPTATAAIATTPTPEGSFPPEAAPATEPSPAPDLTAAPAPDNADAASSFPSPTQLPESSPSPEPESQPSPDGFPSPTQLPAPQPVAPNTAAAPTAAPTASQGYNPQPLGDGYAVLVNYFNRPEVAADVRQVTAQSVGLVAYEQNPFLLAAHTSDSAAATAVLETLRERGFTAIVVDSRRTILLIPFVLGTGE